MAKGLDYVINLLDGSSKGVDNAKSKIGEVDKAIMGANERSNTWAKAIGGIGLLIGGVFATEKIIDFGKESLNAAKTMRLATAQVAQGIQSTGGIAGKSLDELKEKAESLEKTTLFGSEQTLGAESLILTFTKIRGAIFDQTIPAIEDLATRMGGDGPADLKGASVQVGKALNDPIHGLTALQRVGVAFTKVQKEQIVELVKHNNLAAAQKIILAELSTEFGGSAAAARKAAGPQADLKVAYDQLLKAIGPLLENGIAPLVTWLAKGVTQLTEWVGKFDVVVSAAKNGYKWIKDNADIFKDLAIGIGVATTAFVIANPMVLVYTAGLIINGAATYALAAASGILTAAQWALNIAMDANPVGLIITGIALLTAGLIYAYDHSEKFRAVLSGIGEVAKSLIPIFKGLGEIILGALTFNPELIADGFKTAFNGVKAIIADGGIGATFNKGYDTSIKESEAKKKQEAVTAPVGGAAKPAAVTATKPGLKPASLKLGGGGLSGRGSGGEGTAGGRSVKNITITFQSMIKEFTQNVTNLKGEDGVRLKRIFTDLLREAAADAEILAGD
jgi:hypothetical protein